MKSILQLFNKLILNLSVPFFFRVRISIIEPLKTSQSLHLLRWERYAPGPVRAITVAKAKAKGEPKARGRKRKNTEDPEEVIDDPTVHDGVYASKSTSGVAVPPEPPSEIPDLSTAAPEESEVDTTPFPTRATFAGRNRKGSVQHELDFDARRTKFYEWVPSSFWKDHFERAFWAKCVESENMEVAIKSFLIDLGFDPSKIKPRTAAAKDPKAKASSKAKAKSKATAEKPKSQGRGRARGRGRGRGNSAVCRE